MRLILETGYRCSQRVGNAVLIERPRQVRLPARVLQVARDSLA